MLRAICALCLLMTCLPEIARAQQVLPQTYQSNIPEFDKILDYRPALVTSVYARNGELMGMFARERRFLVPLSQIPKHVSDAFLASEDSAFYEHEGIDLQAIFRAFSRNVAAGGIVQGGSTITQQVVKRLLLTSKKSYIRKAREAILAYRLERRLTKDQILNIYLNEIFLGAGSYGVEAASRIYFGKHVTELTIAEAALLAGLPKAPSTYNPYRFPEAAKERQLYVLGRMRDLGWISEEEYILADAQPLLYKSMPDPTFTLGAYYLEEVRRNLIHYLSAETIQRLGLDTNATGEEALYTLGLQIFTNMDPQHQRAGEQALQSGLEDATKRHGWDGPIKTISREEFDAFAAGEGAIPEGELPEGRVKALVTKVTRSGAQVSVGSKQGRIPVETMHWARKPNLKKPTEAVPAIKNALEVLKEGDVVWVTLDSPQDYLSANATELSCALQPSVKLQGALVSIEPDRGDVVALVGGYDFSESSFNRATQAKRQPGSAFKPIVYSAAMDHGFTPASVLYDRPLSIWDEGSQTLWEPKNYSNKFYGPTLLTTALALSRNLVTIQVADRIGMDKVVARAKAMGLGEYPPYLAMALGSQVVTPLQITQAYTAFANNGTMATPRLITAIADRAGRKVVTFDPLLTQAVSPQNAYIMSSMLRHVVQRGTATKARVLERALGGKTGTTNEERDAWFLGFSPYLATGVYVGYDDFSPMGKKETGARAALPIWIDYRKQVEMNYADQDFPVPEGVVTRTVFDVGEKGGRTLELAFIAGQEHGGASYDAETAMYYDELYAGEESYAPFDAAYGQEPYAQLPNDEQRPFQDPATSGRHEELLLKQLF